MAEALSFTSKKKYTHFICESNQHTLTDGNPLLQVVENLETHW
jgi:hypothetical protein